MRNSIVGGLSLASRQFPDHQIVHCAVFGKIDPLIKLGNGSFTADPQFVNPKMLDFRLAGTSPCKGKASDGGDVGCRYTPEMIEILKVALDLRARGMIKF